MINLVYTSLGSVTVGFLSEEIEQVVELKKELIARRPLEHISMHHLAYQDKWYPLFDLQKLLHIPEPLPVRYALMVKNSSTIKCGLCSPSPIEEISLPHKSIYPFPAFLLQKQKICLLYALIQDQDRSLFLCSLSDIAHPIALANYLLRHSPISSTGGKP